VTEFVRNGSLANHLPPTKCRLSGANRITKIIIGIALAMRYLHSRNIIHRELRPDNILLDWDWNVRIADFDRSSAPKIPSLPYSDPIFRSLSFDSRYLAPECYDDLYFDESDVFSFGMIVYELLTGDPVFPKELTRLQIAVKVVIRDERPAIPIFIVPSIRNLITDCWAKEPEKRPSFDEIVKRLSEMRFKVIPNVNSSKMRAFMKKIEEWEASNPTQLNWI
jgi:serine/threonine protein kinase